MGAPNADPPKGILTDYDTVMRDSPLSLEVEVGNITEDLASIVFEDDIITEDPGPRAEIMACLPKSLSLQINQVGPHPQGCDDGWVCPKDGCSQKFDDEIDRNDHAFWHHAWCWECKMDFPSHKAWRLVCTDNCLAEFDKPSDLLGHIENNSCAKAAAAGFHGHALAHYILLDQARDLTNEEKVYLARHYLKVVVLPKGTTWLIDPLGNYLEASDPKNYGKTITESLLKYTWKMHGDEYNDILMYGKFTCFPCGAGYDNPRNFLQHVCGIEYRAFPQHLCVVWKCEECDAAFNFLCGLAYHYEVGCRTQLNEMKAMRKEKVDWDETEKAMNQEMLNDTVTQSLMVGSLELTEAEGGGRRRGTRGRGGDSRGYSDAYSQFGSSDDGFREVPETGVSEPSSEDEKKEEFKMDGPTGLESLHAKLGVEVIYGDSDGDNEDENDENICENDENDENLADDGGDDGCDNDENLEKE
ncbi:hypothetical protein TWF730_007261 [Orbilia blumenaviensis]|uniref:C2H2-type domain-containing protein n=1 Tax=Orbilia blumenaviensis TaxID=1796055 RepID=A0AAV9VA66_9PEZI